MKAPEETPTGRSWRGRIVPRYGSVWFDFAPVVVLSVLATVFAFRGVPGAVALLFLLAMLLGAVARRRLRTRKLGTGEVGERAEVELDDVALRAETKDTVYRLPRSAIRSGHVIPHVEQGAVVVLEGVFRILFELWLPSLAEARAVLDRLALSPRTKPQTFRFFFGLEVVVGVDGVVIGAPLVGRKRFVPHSSIDDVRWTGDHVRLILRDGSSVDIATGDRGEHDTLVERLLHARDAFGAAEGAEPIALLARAGRDTERWVKETRALGNGGSGYRAAALPEETLWRIALDPSEKQELRIGASVALGPKLDEAGRERLKEAAGAAASPRVRVALTAVAETEDEAALVEALEAARKNPR